MSRFGKTMAAIYGAGWEDRVDKRKMRQQYMANRKMFDSIAEKAIADANSGARRLLGNIPSVPNREVNIPTGKLSDLAIGFGATERIMDEQLRNANAIEDPEINIAQLNSGKRKAIPVIEFGNITPVSFEENKYYTDPETGITYNINSPEYREYYAKYLKGKQEDARRREGKLGERLARESINNEAFKVGLIPVGLAVGLAGGSAIASGSYGVNAANIANAVNGAGRAVKTVASNVVKRVPDKARFSEMAEDAGLAADRAGMYIYRNLSNPGEIVKDVTSGIGRFVNNKGAEKFVGDMYKYMPTSFMQQGGQVQNAQQKFLSYIAEIFGIQNEAQLKQVVNKLGKQGIAQLQKAFQQGVPSEQIRQQMQGRAQSAKQGAKITRTGDFVPCAKCGGKTKKKRFADGGAIQSAGCGCSGVRKGCGGMTFSAKCGGKAKKVSKKENGGTVPETHGRPVGGATVLPFLMKNSNKKPKRFNAR